MTGSTLQFLNGIVLLLTFFSCRLVWGTYNSIVVFADVWRAYTAGPLDLPSVAKSTPPSSTDNTVLSFAHGQTVPLWLAGAYLASNLCLNGLNWFWFAKMIETLRKRFDPPLGTRRAQDKDAVAQEKVLVEGTSVLTPAADLADSADYLRAGEQVEVKSSGTHLEVGARSRRRG